VFQHTKTNQSSIKQHINKIKGKNPHDLLNWYKKSMSQNTLSRFKTKQKYIQEIGIEENVLNIIMVIYEKAHS
jgi:hypothetical protein